MPETKLMKDADKVELTEGAETTLHSHPGGGLSKHTDSGIHTISTSKTWEPVAFHDTFPSVPVVVVTLHGVAGGKKSGAGNVTTTGFDITAEATGPCHWVAKEEGYE